MEEDSMVAMAGRPGLVGRLTLGSNAQRVLLTAHCPALGSRSRLQASPLGRSGGLVPLRGKSPTSARWPSPLDWSEREASTARPALPPRCAGLRARPRRRGGRRSYTPTSGDLAGDRDRWPRFVPAARVAGFHSVAAAPMRLRAQTIGALNLFHGRPEPVPLADQRLAQALADVATIGILQQRSAHRSAMLAEQLQAALDSRGRVVIEQAKGVLAERNRVGIDEAFAALRQHARNHNLKLTALALAVIRGDVDPAAVLAVSAST